MVALSRFLLHCVVITAVLLRVSLSDNTWCMTFVSNVTISQNASLQPDITQNAAVKWWRHTWIATMQPKQPLLNYYSLDQIARIHINKENILHSLLNIVIIYFLFIFFVIISHFLYYWCSNYSNDSTILCVRKGISSQYSFSSSKFLVLHSLCLPSHQMLNSVEMIFPLNVKCQVALES